MLFWPTPSHWVAPGFSGRFLSPIGPALPFWVGQKVVKVFLSLKALNSQTNALNSTACATYLKIKIQLARVTTIAMIDLSATRNFMSTKFVQKKQIPGMKTDDQY